MKKSISIVILALLFVQQALPADALEKVVIVTRHGVRAPTWTPERLSQYSISPWPDFGVPPGYLTPRGRELMKIMGAYYHDLYSASGLIGKSACGDAKNVYFWADTDQRTIESSKALAEGIVPGCEIVTNSNKPGVIDPLFDADDAGVAKADSALSMAAVSGRIGPNMDGLTRAYRPEFQMLERVLNGNGKAPKSIFDEPIALKADEKGISMSGPLAIASTFTQILLLEYANGFSGEQLGWGRVSAADVEQLLVLHTAYAELMRRTPYLARIRGSNLLHRVVRTMEQTTKGKTLKGAVGTADAKMVVIVGHDTNISNLAGMLGLSWVVPTYQPDDSPPGGALIFSMWKTSGGDRLVKIHFVAQTLEQMHNLTPLTAKEPPIVASLFVPGCSRAQDGYPCDWKSFMRVTKNAIDPAFVEK